MSWLDYYLVGCLVTAIYAFFKLFLPSIDLIKETEPNSGHILLTKPIRVGIFFFITSFILAPLFLIILLLDAQSHGFIKGFISGSNKK